MTKFIKLYNEDYEISVDVHSITSLVHIQDFSHKEGAISTIEYSKFSITLSGGRVETFIGYKDDRNYNLFLEGYKRLEDFINENK